MTKQTDHNTQPTAAYSDLKGSAPGTQPDDKTLMDEIKRRWPELKISKLSKHEIIEQLVQKGSSRESAVRQVNSFADRFSWTAPSPDPEVDGSQPAVPEEEDEDTKAKGKR